MKVFNDSVHLLLSSLSKVVVEVTMVRTTRPGLSLSSKHRLRSLGYSTAAVFSGTALDAKEDQSTSIHVEKDE